MAEPITLSIDFNVNDRLPAIDALLQRLRPLAELGNTGPLCINLCRCSYLGPDAAAVIGALLLDAKTKGTPVDVRPPEGPAALRAFWRQSGLDQCSQGVLVGAQPVDAHNEAVLPLRRYRQASFQDADPIVDLARSHMQLSEEVEESLRTCVNEVIQNVQDHSRSEIGCLVSARFMIQSQEVRIAIVDRGVGVATTLLPRYPDMTPASALRSITRGEYTAKSRPNNMGVGVSNLCNIVARLRGEIFILSESAAISRRHGGDWQLKSLNYRFGGTGVFFTVPVGE